MNLNRDHITDELLVKYMLGEASEDEQRLVEAWIKSNAANKKQYEAFKEIWEESKKLAAVTTVDEDAAWQRFKGRINAPKQTAIVKTMKPLNWLRIAALFIVIVGAGYFGYRFFSEQQVKNMVVVSHQSTLIDTLPDGSVVTLNKNSSVDYPSKFKGDTRTVALKGEAFFNVTPNKQKPFIIHVNDVTIRVVGTSFNVRSINGVTEVIVETGIVQVSRKNKMVELKPKEKLKISGQDSAMVKAAEPEKLYNYYRSKQFVCDGTPLWKLVEVLNEAYDTTIVIDNPRLRNHSLNTTFENESLDRILEIIQETFNDFKLIKEKDRIILR